MRWPNDTNLYDQQTFYSAFIKDIAHAKQRVIIESPFMTTRRIDQLLPILDKLIQRGVKVIVNTKPFDEHEALLREMAHVGAALLQDIGVEVLMTVGHHRKLAVIDRDILWEGSLNVLSQNDSCEIMRRIKSEQAVVQLLRFLDLDRFYAVRYTKGEL